MSFAELSGPKPGAYPVVARSTARLEELIRTARANGYYGCDLEFSPRLEPTLCGLSAGQGAVVVSLPWDEAKRALRELLEDDLTAVGHFFLTADLPIISRELGILVPIYKVDDTVIRHYLLNSSLCSMPKTNSDGEGDRRGTGYMDLWSTASFWTDLPQWKACRGSSCVGPCPEHDFVGYNGTDAAACDIAYPRQIEAQRRRGISDDLVDKSKRLMLVYERMRQRGVMIDRDKVSRLESESDDKKAKLFEYGTRTLVLPCGACGRMKSPPCKRCREAGTKPGTKGTRTKQSKGFDAPFNPRSQVSVLAYFNERGIPLVGNSKDDIKKALKYVQKNQPKFSGTFDPESYTWLKRLHDYKDSGKGLKSWFDDKYVDAFGIAHPRFILPATSTGRSASSNPNFQNIPKRGFGQEVRGAVIPRDRSLVLVRADYKQLELRVCLWEAGIDADLGYDAFDWLVEHSDGKLPNRDWAKSFAHAFDYLEGMTILYAEDLDNPRTRQAIREGWMLAYKDWPFAGGIVAFTGVNLAERLFGSATRENRKKALALQAFYADKFPELRKWHRRVTGQVERGFVQSRWTTRYLELWGPSGSKSAVEAAKEGAAFFGQGQGADYAQEAILRYDDLGETPVLFVHDELVFERPADDSPERHVEFMRLMEQRSKVLDGFWCPIDVSYGPNWKDLQEIKR